MIISLLVYIFFLLSNVILQGGTQPGAFTTTPAQRFYNDGQWHYIKVTRIGNVATLTDEAGQELASVTSCKWISSSLIESEKLTYQCMNVSSY